MHNRMEISNYDIVTVQIYLWLLTVIFILAMSPAIFLNFAVYELCIALIGLAALSFLHYKSLESWNVWYEDGNICFKNLYRRKTISIERFSKVERSGFIGYVYTLYDDGGMAYQFCLGPAQDLKLFVKLDIDHYAKAITAKLLELKNSRNAA